MKKPEAKKAKKAVRQLRTELELSNNSLVNEQLYCDLKAYRKHEKLQRTIHNRQGWKEYTC